MTTGKILFQHNLSHKESHAIAARQQTLLRALPFIEENYEKLHKHIKAIDISKEDAEHALRFYNAVIADGRYIHELVDAPQQAAEKLGLTVNEKILKGLETIYSQFDRGGRVEGPIEAVIAIAVVIVCAVPGQDVVIDSSAEISLKL